MSPEDTRGYFVVGVGIMRTLSTVKGIDGTERLNHDLIQLVHKITTIKWVYDTDLCVVGSRSEKFVIANFMDESLPAPTFYTLPYAG